MQMRKDLLSRISTLEKELQAKQGSAVEHEKAMRSWQNEKSVLTAAIEAREGKLTRLAELQSQVSELEKTTDERDSLRNEMVREVSYFRILGVFEYGLYPHMIITS